MSDVLNENGAIKVLSAGLFSLVHAWAWPLAMAALVGAYCYVHYGFASMTAHVTALYPAFLAAALAAGVPPVMAALVLAYFSNLNAAMTHLRYRLGSGLLRRGLCVGKAEWWRLGIPDIFGQPRNLARDRTLCGGNWWGYGKNLHTDANLVRHVRNLCKPDSSIG